MLTVGGRNEKKYERSRQLFLIFLEPSLIGTRRMEQRQPENIGSQILVAELCVVLTMRAVLTIELLLDSSIPEFQPFNFSLLP